MSEKKGDKRLGRNPFDHTRPSRPKRHQPEPKAGEKTAWPRPSTDIQESPATVESGPGDFLHSNPAWLFVDFWAGVLTEPYFFWAKSMDIMKKSMESRRIQQD